MGPECQLLGGRQGYRGREAGPYPYSQLEHHVGRIPAGKQGVTGVAGLGSSVVAGRLQAQWGQGVRSFWGDLASG